MEATKPMMLIFSSPIEASDAGRRIISGQIVPFNKIGNTNIGKVIFEQGSIKIPNPTSVKLLAQHNTNDPIGRAQSFNETKTGIMASFKISASQKGTDALLMASEELICGLSVGCEVISSRERKDGTMIVSSAVLKEVSLVAAPAFEEAIVTSVAASAGGDEEISKAIDAVEEEQDPTPNESEATVSEDTSAVSTEAAAADASRVTIKAASPYITSTVRHGITSKGRYVEHKVRAALGNEESKLWIAASEDPQYVTAANDSITTNPAFNPVVYLRDLVSNTNFGRPAIDAVGRGTLSAVGMTFSIPTLVTSAGGGSGVAPTVAATAEAGVPSNTGMVTAYSTQTITKYAGQNTISIELLDRGDPVFMDALTVQMERSYIKAQDAAMIAKLTSAGTQGATTAASSAGIISFVSVEAAACYVGSSYVARNYIAGTSQWSLLMGAVDSTGRPIYNASQPMNAGGVSSPTSIMGNVLGLNLYVDANVVSTTIDESAFIVAPEAATWYESPTAYFSVNLVSSMEVQMAIYGYGSAVVVIPAGIRRFNLT